MREEIIKMAREAGWRVNPEGEILEGDDWHIQTDIVEHFFHMAQAAEREACARVCDDISSNYKWPDDIPEKVASQWCADRIRARGQA